MSKNELSKVYEFSSIESKWYQVWEENKAFKPNNNSDTFTITMPPPNVTGVLHIGHVFFLSLIFLNFLFIIYVHN